VQKRWLCTLTMIGSLAGIPALAAEATTAPGARTTIYVQITDSEIIFFNGNTMPRGVIVTFDAINHGKKKHNFSIFGKTTPVLKPGTRAKFTVTLLTRGVYRYECTINAHGKFFHGLFAVT
jgi:plastocyanin